MCQGPSRSRGTKPFGSRQGLENIPEIDSIRTGVLPAEGPDQAARLAYLFAIKGQTVCNWRGYILRKCVGPRVHEGVVL